MKAFFKRAGKTVAIVLGSVLLIICVTWTLGGAGIFPLRGITAPVQKLIGKGISELEGIFAYMHEFDELEAENQRLKADIAAMEQQVLQSEQALEEIGRLRSLLKLSESNSDYEFVEASLTAWTADSWSASFSIDRGSKAGISLGDCVVTELGFLVGTVTQLNLNSATVSALTDSQSAVGAYIRRSGGKGVASGDFALMSQGLLRLDYVDEGDSVCIGDLILSSGAGGVYPSDLVIGSVTAVKSDASGYSDYGVITPSAELDKLSQVFIIKSFEADDET